MLSVSRRGLIALGGTGAAGLVLAGCGDAADRRADASQSDLLAAQGEAETALAAAYRQAAGSLSPGRERTALAGFAAAASKRAGELDSTAGGNEQPPPDGGPDSPEALSGAIHA